MKNSLVTPLPWPSPAVGVKTADPRAGGGRVEPPVQAAGGKELPGTGGSGAKSADLPAAVASLNDYAQSVRRDLQFAMDETSGHTVITVRDSQTEEVIRQIPSESAVKLASYLRTEGRLQGFGLVEKA
ncbi:MAG: flagellar protein FlaG [Thioalkalivibrio sp.]|nr:MAG: flagellar protein FlaG [Thioalkalivibrio sp.]